MGRFLNADSFASTGQGILGNNMFAYCLNNPVAFEDDSGSAAEVCFGHTTRVPDVPIRQGGGGSTNYNGGMSSLPVSTTPLKKQLTFWEMLTNSDAQVASDAQYFAFYNGVAYVKIAAMNNTAFTFGVVFMGPNSSADLVKHEYGHAVHAAQIGLFDYARFVALPSATSFWLYRNNPYYESQPWERIAEIFGKPAPPTNGYLPFSDIFANWYWLYTLIL